MLKKLLLFFFVALSFNCKAQYPYKADIENWHHKRIESLKKENGWLNLAGLFWLKEGKNTFGSGDDVQLHFPANSITGQAGYFELKNNIVILHTNGETNVLINGIAKNDAIIFHPDSTDPAICSYGSLRWTIIKRENKIGIRLRDLNSKTLKEFKGIECFAVDTTFKVRARLQKNLIPSTVLITNVLGQTTPQPSPGKLIFTLQGKQYTLDALEEGNELFIIFGDATSGAETYPAGRFLYAEKPVASGYTTIDFNKAINPPCAFTPFATCPLPPKQNILPVAITAGEKNFGHH